jgi:hypothetical protein
LEAYQLWGRRNISEFKLTRFPTLESVIDGIKACRDWSGGTVAAF